MKQPQNLVLKTEYSENFFRIDLYKDIKEKKQVRISCIEAFKDTEDLDGNWVCSHTEDASYFVKETEIDQIIAKLKEAKQYLKS